MKVLSVFLFLASFLLVSSILFGISGCSQEQKKQPAQVQQAVKTESKPLPPVPENLPMAVDFGNVALSEVVQFVTSQTGKGVVLTGYETTPITWVEANLTKETLFDSFQAAVTASGLLLEPINDQKTLFALRKPEGPQTTVLLNYARSSRGVFFLLGSTIYPFEKFPYPVRYDSGHWYAFLPKDKADQLINDQQDRRKPRCKNTTATRRSEWRAAVSLLFRVIDAGSSGDSSTENGVSCPL